MTDLDALSAFLLVASNGGITRASRVSGRSKASLSRQVMALEKSLGVRLFDRGSRSIHLTEEGEALRARTAGPLAEIEQAADLLRDGCSAPRGRLRVNVPVLFGQILMGRVAAEFAKAYPQIQLEVSVDDRIVDPAVDGFDVVVRVAPSPDATLVGRCFARDRLLVVAAPSLPAPDPDAAAEERQVPAVVRTELRGTATWRMDGDRGREITVSQVLRLPSFLMVRDAVLTGIGVAKLPQVLVADDLAAGRLVCWGASSEPPFELWALHLSQRHASAKVKAFMRALDAAFPSKRLQA